MVPLSSSRTILISDAINALQREIDTSDTESLVELAFLNYLLNPRNLTESWDELLNRVNSCQGAQITYREVAVLGYALASGVGADYIDLLHDHLTWLSGCQPFLDNVPMGFYRDAIAMLGISLGTINLNDDTVTASISAWMDSFVPQSIHAKGMQNWHCCILATAYNLTKGSRDMVISECAEDADVRVALTAKNVFMGIVSDEDESAALLQAVQGPNFGIGATRAAVRITAVNWVRRSIPTLSLNRPTAEDLCGLLKRVPFALNKWTWESTPKTSKGNIVKWTIENEYHVQNLLWALLAPIFGDLIEEGYTPSVGPTKSRFDLGIPSMGLIIEVKFMKQGTSGADVVRQISEDVGLYLVSGSQYSKIIAFIWDESRRSELHDNIIRGVNQIKGITGTVIVSRPGSWQ